MKELLLFGAVLVFMLAGGWLMGRLDQGLARRRTPARCPALRIALEDPAVLDSITELLERFSADHPAWEIFLYYGDKAEILRQLEHKQVDFALVSAGEEAGLHAGGALRLKRGLLSARNRTVRPLTEAAEPLESVWYESGEESPAMKNFETMLVSAYGQEVQ